MGYGKKIYEEARAELDRRRQSAKAAAEEKRAEFYRRCPEAEDVQNAIRANAAGAARAVVSGGDVRAAMLRLKERAAELNAEYDRLLKQAGMTRRDIAPQYSCEKCRDTGFSDGRMCSCLRQLQRTLAYRDLSMNAPLERSTFGSFSLDYYKDDPRAAGQMENIFSYCRSYAENFRSSSPSLLFKGGTGLGKTHLSLAIAGAVIEKGFGVIYGSVQSFAVALERERFDRREDDAGDTGSQLLGCDLLILDDLGTEFPSGYVNAVLYDIINSRILAGKPTIISTNLSLKELEGRYGERFASRIVGCYGTMEFLGPDIRVQKSRRRRSK